MPWRRKQRGLQPNKALKNAVINGVFVCVPFLGRKLAYNKRKIQKRIEIF